MKRLAKKVELCTACQLCEDLCSKTYFKEENREKSSIRIETGEKGDSSIIACTQCGVCMEICPAQAIYRDKNGIIRIKKELCVGCFACVGFCPEGAMFQHHEYLEPFKCVACGICTKQCPTGAIFIEEVS